jgi:hypothetical protein
MRDRCTATMTSSTKLGCHGGSIKCGSKDVPNPDLAAVQGLSCILLYVDVQTAFASMVRSLAIPMQASDHVFLERLHDAGFSDHDIHNIVNNVYNTSFQSYASSNTHLVSILRDIFNNSWLSYELLKISLSIDTK